MRPIQSLAQNRYPLAVVAGLLLAASFPAVGIAGCAWVAPALMLGAGLGKSGGERFRIGYAAGLAFYLAELHWLLLIPYRWHGIPLGPAAGWIALSAYLALYPALWVWLVLRPTATHLPSTGETAPGPSWLTACHRLSSWPWHRRLLWTLSAAAVWVALEMVIARLWGGFPWDLLGVTQHRLVPLIQLASVTGVYGVSFLVTWTSISMLCAAVAIVERPALRSLWVTEVILPLLAVLAAFIFGFQRLGQAQAVARELRVTLIQPSIPQTLIWNPEKNNERFQSLIALSEQALTNRTDLLIWPEAAIPNMLRYDEATYTAVTNLAVRHHVWMIVGSDDAELPAGSKNPEEANYFNSSFLISPEGRLAASYRKRNLVIFGEYIPLVRWLPFVKWFTPIEGGFTPGRRSVPFELTLPPEGTSTNGAGPTEDLAGGGIPVKTAVLICFEDTFPELAREDTGPDTDFLVNLTNDGWFGEDAAQWQHAATALFRTVEEGVPLVRCTNTGLTCWYDAWGRRRELFIDTKGTIYGPGFLTARIPLRPQGAELTMTLYHQWGDWFGWSCVAVAAVMLARAGAPRRRKSGTPPERIS